MQYYLKQCGFQELGSVGDDGRPKRGRYLLTSMNPEVLAFFPTLSRNILNDSAVLPIIPLYLGKKTYCNFVYHNSKYNGSTAKHKRNEYRIYLNNELEGHRYFFEAEDIMILRGEKIHSGELEEEQTVYYLDLLKDHSSQEYIQLSRHIDAYPINGGYGIYDGELSFFEEKVTAIINGQFNNTVVIDPSVTDRINKASEENRSALFNPATFRDFVLAGYGNACAVTGKRNDNIMGTGIDVVYIKPRSVGGSCMPSNGLPLDRKLSLPFIRGLFTLTNNYEVEVHPECGNVELLALNHRQIRVPPSKFFQPDRDSISYHRDFVFGSFVKESQE